MNKESDWYLKNKKTKTLLTPFQKINIGSKTFREEIFKKGEFIYKSYDRADKIFFINDGRVKVGSYSESGKEHTKTILAEHEMFGELALVGEGRRTNFAFAMEKTSVCMVSIKEMKDMMQEDFELNFFIMEILGARVSEMEQRLESLVFKNSRTRIIEYVVNLTHKKGQRVGYEIVVRKFLTHREIANITATSRQTVTTILNELRNKNIITFNRKRLLVRDVGSLQTEMKGS